MLLEFHSVWGNDIDVMIATGPLAIGSHHHHDTPSEDSEWYSYTIIVYV